MNLSKAIILNNSLFSPYFSNFYILTAVVAFGILTRHWWNNLQLTREYYYTDLVKEFESCPVEGESKLSHFESLKFSFVDGEVPPQLEESSAILKMAKERREELIRWAESMKAKKMKTV